MGELAKEILPVNIEDELKQSYLDYAMSVIIGSALPDARDGLKPVHRRVLFAMSELERKSGGSGKSVSVRVDLGGRRLINKKEIDELIDRLRYKINRNNI